MTEISKTGHRVLMVSGVFARDCSGSTAIEYALIAAGISIAIVASVANVGSAVVGLFTAVAALF